jgi:rhodanese-related sulfurtransferase
MEVEPAVLERALATPTPPYVLDVREAWEFALGHLPGAHLVPLGHLPARLAEIPRHRELVTVCHHGGRSLSARALLIRAGFSPVRSLAGGMDAWAAEIDREMKRY